jgi:hypothetical protein
MKARFGFVTNSSSTSYVLAIGPNFKIKDFGNKYYDRLFKAIQNDFELIFEKFSRNNDEYGVETITTLEELAEHFERNMYDNEAARQFRAMVYTKMPNGHYDHSSVNASKLGDFIKQHEGNYYDKDGSYIKWLRAIVSGHKIYKLTSSHHDEFMCALMAVIADGEDVIFIENQSG